MRILFLTLSLLVSHSSATLASSSATSEDVEALQNQQTAALCQRLEREYPDFVREFRQRTGDTGCMDGFFAGALISSGRTDLDTILPQIIPPICDYFSRGGKVNGRFGKSIKLIARDQDTAHIALHIKGLLRFNEPHRSGGPVDYHAAELVMVDYVNSELRTRTGKWLEDLSNRLGDSHDLSFLDILENYPEFSGGYLYWIGTALGKTPTNLNGALRSLITILMHNADAYTRHVRLDALKDMPKERFAHFLQRPQTFTCSPNVLHLLSLLPEEHWTTWDYDQWCRRFREENLPYLFEQLRKRPFEQFRTIPADERYACVRWMLACSNPHMLPSRHAHGLLCTLFLSQRTRITTSWPRVINHFIPLEAPQNRFTSPFANFEHIEPLHRLAFMECVNGSTLADMKVRKAMARALSFFDRDFWDRARFLLDGLFSGLDEAQAEGMLFACWRPHETFITRLHQWTAAETDPKRKLAFVQNMAILKPEYHVYEVFERLERLFEGNDPAAVYERLRDVPQQDRYLTLALAALKPTPEARLAALAPNNSTSSSSVEE